jgi:hypothetical protein
LSFWASEYLGTKKNIADKKHVIIILRRIFTLFNRHIWTMLCASRSRMPSSSHHHQWR